MLFRSLIDSHMHAIRAASFFATETNWAGVPTLVEALERIRQSAASKNPGEWVIVGGGWKAAVSSASRRGAEVFAVSTGAGMTGTSSGWARWAGSGGGGPSPRRRAVRARNEPAVIRCLEP